MKNKVIVIVTDGVGIAKPSEGNAVDIAKTPTFDSHWGADPFKDTYSTKNSTSFKLIAHGEHVGLPEGIMGNSEVGHSTIFCGKPYLEMLPDITSALKDGRIFSSKAWDKIKERKENTTHFLGLLSDGKVHSDIEHLISMLNKCAEDGIRNVKIWALSDGRDVKPASIREYAEKIEKLCLKINEKHDFNYAIAMIAGRGNVLMDRGEDDWKRVEKAWNALFFSEGRLSVNASIAIEELRGELYGQSFTDEHLDLRLITQKYGMPPKVNAGDNLILFNFRSDRIVQFCSWMLDQELTKTALSQSVTRKEKPEDINFVTMANFDPETLPLKNYFLPELEIETTLIDFLEKKELKIFCSSEPSKFPHVTLFPNSRSNKKPEHCTWYKIASEQRPPFNEKPEMSSKEITKTAISAMDSDKYDLLIINYPAPDMVGHETNLEATIKAVEATDSAIAELEKFALKKDYILIYGADHGNAEKMYALEDNKIILDKNDEPQWHTAHTSNPVRWNIIIPESKKALVLNDEIKEKSLGNLSSTIANLLGFKDLPKHWLKSLIKL